MAKREQDHGQKVQVKNTFLEFPHPEDTANDDFTRGRRTRSDTLQDHRKASSSPLVVASKSPNASPGLHPVDETMQAVPIDEVDFELLEEAAPMDMEGYTPSTGAAAPRDYSCHGQGELGNEPAYIVPTTPSPFLHSAFPPTTVPPFGYGSYMGGGLNDMGLPPAAFGADGEGVEGAAGFMPDPNCQYPQGMPFMPNMYDPRSGQYMGFGWPGMPMDGQGFGVEGIGPSGQFMGYGGDPAAAGGAFGAGYAQGADGAQGLEGASEGADRKGRRAKGRKKDGMADEKAAMTAGDMAPAGSGSGSASKAAQQIKPGDLDAAAQANQAALDADEEYTTVMLRNIPNKYTREMLIKQLKVDFNGVFDFMYLPIDFKNKCNVGYGFINFRTQDACEFFVKSFHGVDVRKCLPGLNSKKVVEVTPARVQGLIENVRRLKNSPVMNQLQDHPEWMPLLFDEYGREEPFPSPDQPLPPVKPRGRARGEGVPA